MMLKAQEVGSDLPACSCRHAGPLGQELIVSSLTGEVIRFTCPGCGKSREIEVATGARMPRFLP